jgi:hypothetical protein
VLDRKNEEASPSTRPERFSLAPLSKLQQSKTGSDLLLDCLKKLANAWSVTLSLLLSMPCQNSLHKPQTKGWSNDHEWEMWRRKQKKN